MNLTVAICTWNRAASLRQCLATLARCRIPSGLAWEVLVVDNNCTDDTRHVVESFVGDLPIRSVAESQPGLSFARNRAVQEARGAFLTWIDDDVFVSPDWVQAYVEAMDAQPDTAVFGGPVEVVFEHGPPDWLARTLDRLGPIYGERDLGPLPIALAPAAGRIPFGCNYGVRRDAHRAYRYDPRLGRRPTRPDLGREEIEVLVQMLEDGYRGMWVPAARVQHVIGRARQTLKYVWTQCAGDGEYLSRRESDHTRAAWLRRAAFARRAFVLYTRYRLKRAVLPVESWIADFAAAADAWGRLRGLQPEERR